MSTKDRVKLCHRFLQRSSLEYRQGNAIVQMNLAHTLCTEWEKQKDLAIEEVQDRIDNPEKYNTSEPETAQIQEAISNTKETDSLLKESERKARDAEKILQQQILPTEEATNSTTAKHTSFSLDVTLNAKQRLAVDFARSGKSFVLTGPAGSGKTTTEREIVKALLERDDLTDHYFKDKRSGQRHYAPSIAVVSFTNKAASTSAKAIFKDPALAKRLPYNVTTIHNLLEYEPEFYETDEGKQTMRFFPRRNEGNPLDITHIIIEEASNVGATDLYQALYAAMRPGITIILVGDINQLPPVFGASILNYGLVQLPVVELTEIYRQALDSPIIGNAHRILRGEHVKSVMPYFVYIGAQKTTKLPSQAAMTNKLISSLKKWITTPDPTADGEPIYDPRQDIILSAYNVGDCGTKEINNHVAQFLGAERNAVVYEVLTGMTKQYLAVGDNVLYFKREAIIKSININAQYMGKAPQVEGTDLTRWGIRIGKHDSSATAEEIEAFLGYENMNVDAVASADENDKESLKRKASHIVTIEYEDGETDALASAGDFSENNFSLGYALTVHKSQGSEWRKVFYVMHKDQVRNINREMLYTAVTRARTHCMILDHSGVFERCLATQRVKGDTVEEKIAWFNSKVSLSEPIRVIK